MANAPKILGTDKLRQAYPKMNQAIDNANEAITKAVAADSKSSEAVVKANSVQEQFNQVVIEGDSSVEAAQARVKADGSSFTTLKGRLDDTDAQLAEKAQRLKNIWVDVKQDFGAKGDGVTDDTAAITSAINSLRKKGGTIYFPDGVYSVSNLVINFSFVRILGQSKRAILKLKSGANTNVLSIVGLNTSYCSINSIKIDGNKANNTSGKGLYIEHNTAQTVNDNPPNLPTNMYDARHQLDDILIENCAEEGWFIEDYVPGVGGSGVRELYVGKIYIGYCGKTGLVSYAQDSMFQQVTSHHSPRGIFIGGGNCKFSDIKTFWCNSDNENFLLDSTKPYETASVYINAVRTEIVNLEIQDWYGKYGLSIKDSSDLIAHNLHIETYKGSDETSAHALYVDGGTRQRISAYTNFNSSVSTKMGKITINNITRLYLDLMTRQDYTDIVSNNKLVITGTTNSFILVNERVRHDTLVDVFEFINDTQISVTTGNKGIKFKRNNKDRAYFYVNGANGQVRIDHYDNLGTYKGAAWRINEDGSLNIGLLPSNGGKIGVFGNAEVSQQSIGADATDLASAIALVNELKSKLRAYGWFS